MRNTLKLYIRFPISKLKQKAKVTLSKILVIFDILFSPDVGKSETGLLSVKNITFKTKIITYIIKQTEAIIMFE